MKPEHLYKLLSTEQIGSDAWYKIIRDFIDEQDIKNVSIRLGKLSYKNDWYNKKGIALIQILKCLRERDFYGICVLQNGQHVKIIPKKPIK